MYLARYALKAADDGGAGLPIGLDDLAQLLWVELLRERGGAHQVKNITVSCRRSAAVQSRVLSLGSRV